MNESDLIALLQGEGFSHICVWQDVSDARNADHAHPMETAHIILSGEMTLTTDGRSNTYRAGERSDVPADAVHSAIMGPHGCHCVIGERWS